MNFIRTNLKYITVYGLAFVIIYTLLWPMYSGGGLQLLPIQTTLDKQAVNTKMEEDLKTSISLKETGDAMQKDYLTVSPAMQSLISQAIPYDHDTPRLINDLSVMMESNENLKMSQTRFDKYDPNKEIKGKSGAFQVAFSVRGSYAAVKKSLQDLESSRRIFNINQISIQPKDDMLELSVTMNAFYLKDLKSKAPQVSDSILTDISTDPTIVEMNLLAGQNVNFTNIRSNLDKISKLYDRAQVVGVQTATVRPNPFIQKQ